MIGPIRLKNVATGGLHLVLGAALFTEHTPTAIVILVGHECRWSGLIPHSIENSLIKRDEALHTVFFTYGYARLNAKKMEENGMFGKNVRTAVQIGKLCTTSRLSRIYLGKIGAWLEKYEQLLVNGTSAIASSRFLHFNSRHLDYSYGLHGGNHNA